MSRQTEDKFNELSQWYREHEVYLHHPDMNKRMEALHTILTNILWLLTYVVEDIQVLEHRRGRGGTGLVLPQTVKLDQGLREGGDQR